MAEEKRNFGISADTITSENANANQLAISQASTNLMVALNKDRIDSSKISMMN